MRFANPTNFKSLSSKLTPLFSVLAFACLIPGLYLGLYASPIDAVQHDSVRIMYIHVPAAWVSMMAYASLGSAGIAFLVWKHIVAGLYIRAVAPVGAVFTAICLVSGSLWGMPTWGTWWVWDARLTSMLILFFLYIGIILLDRAYDHPDRGLMASSWLSIIGLINLPIIKFSVDWWNTLHQPASLTSFKRMGNPSIAHDMLIPLLVMAAGFTFLFFALAFARTQQAIDDRKASTNA